MKKAGTRSVQSRYVDGYVLPILKSNVAAYQKMAKKACKMWLEHGALEYRECVGEDLEPGYGMPFPRIVKLKPDETVVFAWITYKSRAHRDRVNSLVHSDPRIEKMAPDPMPFNMKRMSYGGFKIIVSS